MKKNIFLSLLGLSFLLIGAGCSSQTKPTEEKPNITDEVLVETTEQQQAYLFCTGQNYEIQIRYEGSLNKNVAYCVFDQKKECESIAFLKGLCPVEVLPTEEEKIARMFQPLPGDEFPLRLCEPKAEPVCGVDNKTYTNPCVAEFLGVQVQDHSACKRSSDIFPVEANTSPIVDISDPKKKNNRTSNNSGQSGQKDTTKRSEPKPGTIESANTNTWVNIPLSLLQATNEKNTRIDRCVQGGTTTFYVYGSFEAIYNAKGEVICYPKHDINNACPTYVTNNTYKSSCTTAVRS